MGKSNKQYKQLKSTVSNSGCQKSLSIVMWLTSFITPARVIEVLTIPCYFQDSQDMTNFGTVLFYCLLIILLPIAAFFTSKSFVFDGILKLESVKSNIYSACVAVFALHIALGEL